MCRWQGEKVCGRDFPPQSLFPNPSELDPITPFPLCDQRRPQQRREMSDDTALNNGCEKVSVTDSTPENPLKPALSKRKQHKKLVRLLTVMAYVFSVSLGAIVLSLYYVFLWDPQIQRDGKRLNPMPLPQGLRAEAPDYGNGSWTTTDAPAVKGKW